MISQIRYRMHLCLIGRGGQGTRKKLSGPNHNFSSSIYFFLPQDEFPELPLPIFASQRVDLPPPTQPPLLLHSSLFEQNITKQEQREMGGKTNQTGSKDSGATTSKPRRQVKGGGLAFSNAPSLFLSLLFPPKNLSSSFFTPSLFF